MVAHCVRAVVARSCANALALHARGVKASRQVVKRVGLPPWPGGSVANLSRLGEEDLVTNLPRGWGEGKGEKAPLAAALVELAEAGDARQR